MDESNGWPPWLEISDYWDRILALYRSYLRNMIWLCPIMVAVAVLPAVNTTGLTLRLAVIIPISIGVWTMQVPFGFLAVSVTYLFSSTLKHPFSPRTFNTILYVFADGFLTKVSADLAIFEHLYRHPGAHLAAARVMLALCLVVAVAGQWTARTFLVPYKKKKLTFELKQIFVLTAWISLVLPLCLASQQLAFSVAVAVSYTHLTLPTKA